MSARKQVRSVRTEEPAMAASSAGWVRRTAGSAAHTAGASNAAEEQRSSTALGKHSRRRLSARL